MVWSRGSNTGRDGLERSSQSQIYSEISSKMTHLAAGMVSYSSTSTRSTHDQSFHRKRCPRRAFATSHHTWLESTLTEYRYSVPVPGRFTQNELAGHRDPHQGLDDSSLMLEASAAPLRMFYRYCVSMFLQYVCVLVRTIALTRVQGTEGTQNETIVSRFFCVFVPTWSGTILYTVT